jgi:hypothetical protein
MLVRLTTGATLVFRLIDDIGSFFRRERPAGLLRLGSDVWVIEGGCGGGKEEEEGETDHLGEYGEPFRHSTIRFIESGIS